MSDSQAPVSMGFSRQEYWTELPYPSPGDLPDPGNEPTSLMSPALAGEFFTTSTPWEAHVEIHIDVTISLYVIFRPKKEGNPAICDNREES